MLRNFILWTSIALFACACTSSQTPMLPTPTTEQDLSAFVEKADARAKEVIDAANASETYKDLGGPFKLEDFDKQAEETTRKDREAVMVVYKIDRPVQFLGGIAHFWIYIYRDNGEVEFVGGR